MPSNQPQSQSDNFPANPLLKKLIEMDGQRCGSTVVLEGYIGPAPEGKFRLYPDLNANIYYEATASDVVHYEVHEKPDVKSKIILVRDALLKYVQENVRATYIYEGITRAEGAPPPPYGPTLTEFQQQCVDECRTKAKRDRDFLRAQLDEQLDRGEINPGEYSIRLGQIEKAYLVQSDLCLWHCKHQPLRRYIQRSSIGHSA